MNIWTWQLVFMAIAFFFGWLSFRPRFLWSEWPRICVLVSCIISLILMVLALLNCK